MTAQPPAATDTGPVTALFSRRPRPGHEPDFQEWLHRAVTTAGRSPGHLGAQVLHEPTTGYYRLLYTFTDTGHLQAWLNSEERRQLQTEGAPLSQDIAPAQALTGLETWFQLPEHSRTAMIPPARWRMWLLTLIAAYPLVTLMQLTLLPATAAWPLPVRSAVLSLVLLTVMTYLVMPHISRLFRRFLYPAATHPRRPD